MKYKQYPKYKDSGVEWIGDIPEYWEVLSYSHVTNRITYGFTIPMPSTVEGPWMITAKDIKNNKINFQTSRKTDQKKFDVELSKKSKPNLGTVLITKDGTLGETAIVDSESLCINQSVASMEPNEKVTSKYLQYSLMSNHIQNSIYISSDVSTMGHIAISDLAKWKTCFPDIKNQQQIVDFLDKKIGQFDELIAKSKAQITLLEEKRQATINQAVTKGLDPSVPMKDSGVEWIGKIPEGWEVKKIKRDTPIMRGASPRPIDDQRFFDDEGEYAWVRISDVTRSNGKLQKTTQRLSDEGSRLSVKLHPGELFLSIAGSVGKPCVADIKCCIHDGFVYFPKLTINKKILYYIFKVGKCYGGLGKLGTQLNLNTDTVGNIKIPVPPKNESDEISEFLDKQIPQFDKLIAKSKAQITLLEEKRHALITAAITGKIDVRCEIAV
jgi:type I restriction enzyme, S subunit